METIIGIEVFPLISFVIFFIFFVGLFVWVGMMKKEEVNQLSQMPLGDINDQKNPKA